jgi:hypothetical protein
MPRPTVITAPVAQKIALLYKPGVSPAAFARLLSANGIDVNPRTLSRYLEKWNPSGRAVAAADAQEAPSKPAEGDERFSPESLLEDLRRRYLEACSIADSLTPLAREGGPELPRWLGTVQAVGTLATQLAAIVPPKPMDPDKDPANRAANQRLIARVDEMIQKAAEERQPVLATMCPKCAETARGLFAESRHRH